TQRSFRSLMVRVLGQEFFVSDGTIPIIYKGNTANWTATKYMQEKVYFSLVQPLENNSFYSGVSELLTANMYWVDWMLKTVQALNFMTMRCKNRSMGCLIPTDNWLQMLKQVKVSILIITATSIWYISHRLTDL
ncbi:MAG: hypothetical protein RSF34_16970, partial [Flavobacterium sp.]